MRKLSDTKIVLASHNKGKLREIQLLLGAYGIECVSAGDLGLEEPEETETSFAGNARLKAHFAAKAAAGRGLWELRNVDGEEVSVGDKLSVERFEVGQKVDVTGQSKGKGFQGGIKRWNFTMQDATHGNSLSHRSIGSIGQCQTPGRVWKGKKMAGHMGSEQVTTQSLEIVRVDAENNLLLIKGAVPGAPGGDVIVRPTVKIRR